MNKYMKLLTDLINAVVAIEEEDKTIILLNFLPGEEYETFVLTLINDKQALNNSVVILIRSRRRRQISNR